MDCVDGRSRNSILDDIIVHRRSSRTFSTEVPPKELIMQIITAGMHAPYAALAGFVVAEAIIFVPLLAIAFSRVPGAVQSAATVTALGFIALTAVAFMSRKDFSFLGASLRWVGLMALVAIVAAVIFGFELGTWFSVGMIALAGVAILYDTSNVIHHYPTDRHVAASLQLFASVALMLWYVLRLFMSRD